MRRIGGFNILKKSAIISAMVLCFTGLTYGISDVYAEDATVRENIETTAASGKIIIGVEGYDYTSAQQDILNRINEIRYEACISGNVPNPNNPSKMLTKSDYKPIALGVNCTKAATIRSAEASVRLAHTRPNSYACSMVFDYFNNSSMGGSGENLAWSNEKESNLDLWYDEKSAWINRSTTEETGHYESLINPSFLYCGIATFNPVNDEIYTGSGWKADWSCTAGTFSSADNAIEIFKDAQSVQVIQKMEILTSSVTNMIVTGNQILNVGDNTTNKLYVDTSYNGAASCTVKNCYVYDGVTWSSSDNDVVSINSKTGEVSAKKVGKARLTASIGTGTSAKEKVIDCIVVPEGVEPVEAENPDVVYCDSFKTPTLSNSVSIRLSDGTSVDVTPIWDSYDSGKLESHFRSNEFNVTGKACGLDVVQKVHVNAAIIKKVYPKEKNGSTYTVIKSKTTDSGTAISYPSIGIDLSNGYSWTYPATWTTMKDYNYKKRAGGTFTEEGYTTVSTDEGSKKLEVSFELIVNPASVTSVVYDENNITTPSGTEPEYPIPTVTWSNGDIDNVKSPGSEYGYIKWDETDDYKAAYKKRAGGSYQITGTYFDAVNKVYYDESTSVKIIVTPATVTSVVYDDAMITVENGTSPADNLPDKATVTWSNGDVEDVDIAWSNIPVDNYTNMNKQEKLYTVKGTIDCDNDITKELSITYKVLPPTVKEAEEFGEISTIEGVEIDNKLPKEADIVWSNGFTTTEEIVWDEVDSDKLNNPDSTFVLNGSLKGINGTENAVAVSIYVHPKSLTSLDWYDDVSETISESQTAKGTIFYDNYDFSKVSGKVIATYDNGTSLVMGIGNKQLLISGYDNKSEEKSQIVNISYKYDNKKDEPITKSVNMELILHLPERLIIVPPTKCEYIEGQELDMAGFSATTYYDDNTVKKYKEGTVNYTISGYDKSQIGTQTVNVSQDGILEFFEVNVIAKIATDIEVTGVLPQKVENAFKTDDAKVKVTYNDGDIRQFDLKDLCSDGSIVIKGYDNTTLGKQTIQLVYNDINNENDSDIKINYDIEVKDKIVENISITENPDRLQYVEGLNLVLTGGKVQIFYDNDTDEVRDITESMISGYDNSIIGNQDVTVTIEGKSDTFTVTVREKQIESVAFTGPSKTVYLEGQDFDLSGVSAVIKYDNDTSDNASIAFDSDGSTLAATALLYSKDESISNKNLKAGSYTFNIVYKSYISDDYSIEVKAPVKDMPSEITKEDMVRFESFNEASSNEDIMEALEGATIEVPCAGGTNVETVITKEMICEPETLDSKNSISEEEKKMVEDAEKNSKVVKKVAIQVSKNEEDEPVYTYVYLAVDKKPEPTPTPTVSPTPIDDKTNVTPTPEPTPMEEPVISQDPSDDDEYIEPGKVVTVGSARYKVLDEESVEYAGVANKKIKSVVVPASVDIMGDSYQVTAIGANAFKGCNKLKSVKIGANVATIGDSAFYKCTSLTSVTIPKKVKKIGKKAFYGCKKLKTITIKTTKLKKSTIGSKAFKGIYKKAKFKCPKSKLKNYKKWLKKAGAPKKAKYKK